MKKSILFVCIALIMFSSIYAEDEIKTVAVLKKVIKNVTHNSSENDSWTEAEIGLPLKTGDGLKTGERSLAVISFLDGSVLLVRAESIVHVYGNIENGKEDKETHIESGVVGFDIRKQSQDEEFNFTTPTGLASIRGTNGFFKVDPDETLLVVEKGIIDVKGIKGLKQSGTVSEGNSAIIRSDGSVEIAKTTNQNRSLLDKIKKTKTVKYRIKTDDGEYEIEILDKQK